MHTPDQFFEIKTTPLPGSVAYDNQRVIKVKGHFDHCSVGVLLAKKFPSLKIDYWLEAIAENRLLRRGQMITLSEKVRAGDVLTHIIPETIEPSVNNRIKTIHEDDCIIAYDKPAPLPMHPCGRYNKNTLTSMLNYVWPERDFYLVHRLDSNTTGVLLLAKSKDCAQQLHIQFKENRISKTYLARVRGIPKEVDFDCKLDISRTPTQYGKRTVEKKGLSAHTKFKLLQVYHDNTSLLQVKPITGRTNQIRIHLLALKLPIIGDTVYPSQKQQDEYHIPSCESLCLNAHSISFLHPGTNKRLDIASPSPDWAPQQ